MMKPPKRQCKITFFLKHASLNRQGVINIFPKRHAPLRSASLRADEWAAQAATSACGCRLRLVKFPPHDLKHQGCHSLRSSMALPPCRHARIIPLPRVPPSAVYPHRHPARTARFVAHASGLAALDLMHAPQSSPAFSLRSGVSMLTAPRHTRPLRPSCNGVTGFTGTSPCPGQTSLRSVAQGEACGRAIDPVVRPSAIGHQVGHRPFPATLVGTPPALTAWCNCTNGEVHLRIAPLVIA